MNYLSAIIYTSMIPDFNKLVNGSSLSLPAHPSSRTFGSLRGRRTGWSKGNTFSCGAFRKAKYEIRRRRNPSSRTLCVHYGARSEGGPRRTPLFSQKERGLRGKQKFLLFACPVASRRLCYGARPSEAGNGNFTNWLPG